MDTPISCLVVDDEPLARQLLERFIGRVASLQWVGSCTNAVDAIDAVRTHRPDLLFLDIEMPELSGLHFLDTFTTNRPQIILTTAYPKYALEGYEYDVTDYLLKPIRFERFVQAVNKAYIRTNGSHASRPVPALVVAPPVASVQAVPPTDGFVWVSSNKKKIRLAVREIIFAESMKDYTRIHLTDQRIDLHTPLSTIEQLVSPDEFMRINRSYIIRRDAVVSIQGNTVELVNKISLPIGITYRELVRERLK